MRITQGLMVSNQVGRLQQRLERFERSQSQLGTGKRLLRPSDDPASTNRGLMLRAAQRAREQEARNGADALTWLNLADSKLQGATTRLHRARDLVVSGASDRNPAEDRAIASEIAKIREELIGIANSRHAGRPLFSGYSDAAPVRWVEPDPTAAPPVPGHALYEGDDGAIMRRVSEHDRVRVNVTAKDVFGVDSDPATGDDLFGLLHRIENLVLDGDRQGLAASLGDLDDALGRIGDQHAVIGAATNRVDAVMLRNRDDQLIVRTELAETEDVDVAEGVMELQIQEVAYQATLAALSRVLQPSLVDFLR